MYWSIERCLWCQARCFLRPDNLTCWSHSQQKVLTQSVRELLYSLEGAFLAVGGVVVLGFLKTGEFEASSSFLFLVLAMYSEICWARLLVVMLPVLRLSGDWCCVGSLQAFYTHWAGGEWRSTRMKED